MRRKSNDAALFATLGLIGLVVIALVIAFSVSVFACLAMVLMNVILPLFDVEYPLTWLQAFGVGGAILIIKAVIGVVTVKQ